MVFWLSMIKRIASRLMELEDPLIVTHIDADGLTSGAIIYRTLQILDKDPEIIAIKQLDQSTYELIDWERDLVFTDLGSGQIELTQNHVIIDHHQPIKETKYQLNAHFLGLDGSRDISSAGLAYLVSRELIGDSKLAIYAVVGMVGDRIDKYGLRGLARIPVETSYVFGMKGLLYFGRETRILPVFLEYATEPFIPGLTGNLANCFEFLEELGIDTGKTYHELSLEERRKLVNELLKYASRRGVKVHEMIGEYFIFPSMPRKTELRDASEFATLLNACGRHEKAELAIDLLLGKNVYNEAKRLLKLHRRLIGLGINELLEKGLADFGSFKLFVAEKVKPTIIGIVAGLALSSRLVKSSKPIVAVAKDKEGFKVSARATDELVRHGINLGMAMREAAKGIGEGGGHSIAAGAFIPENKLEEFLKRLDNALRRQLS